jgi:hypothetical protein
MLTQRNDKLTEAQSVGDSNSAFEIAFEFSTK